MSKKGSKGKGAKGRQNTTPTTQTAPPAVQEEAQPSAAHEEPQVPKFPPYEVLNSTPSSSTEAIEAARNLLNKTIRVTLSDGRIIIGQLLSLDNYQNLVLSNTYQAHIKAVEGSPANIAQNVSTTKQMGSILVPGESIVKEEDVEDMLGNIFYSE